MHDESSLFASTAYRYDSSSMRDSKALQASLSGEYSCREIAVTAVAHDECDHRILDLF
jgi:hypothetical protein